MVGLVKEVTDVPCAVGFGISTPEQAAKMCESADGVIVGSAIVKICAEYGKDCVEKVEKYVKVWWERYKFVFVGVKISRQQEVFLTEERPYPHLLLHRSAGPALPQPVDNL